MSGFGVSIGEAADKLEAYLPEDESARDWSVDAAIFLALAYLALRRVEKRGGIFRLVGKLLVFPVLERAWQELIHIRVRLPADVTTEDFTREVSITKTGRVVYESKVRSTTKRRSGRDVVHRVEDRKRDVGARYAQRVRPRVDQ